MGGEIRLAGLMVEQGQARLSGVVPKDHHPRLTAAQLLAVGHRLQAAEFNKAGADHHEPQASASGS